MTGSNKILTVSYGTFSCTLEGFDEPFDAMRGIAEYFRDLAADDRYFGAEPPTPDPEMLQNIAQREVQRRVEARTSETGIALTQTPAPRAAPVADAVEVQAAPAAQPSPAALDQGPLAYDDEYLMADEPEDVLTVDQTVPPAGETEPVETVAEKLRRIRAVVSRVVEPGDAPNSFSAAPADSASAGADVTRDRALTRTINEITADLADDDFLEDDALDTASSSDLADDFVDTEEVENLAALDALGVSDDAKAREDNAFADDDPDETDESDSDEDNSLIANVLSQSHDDAVDASDAASDKPSEAPERPHHAISKTDDNVDRLLKETNQQFADDAGIRRRRVISQMRAAVAATKAEQVLLNDAPAKKDDAEEATAYRNDLRRAMTTRLLPQEPEDIPEPEAKAPEREASAKPPPLVLVSSQRVDQKPKTEPVDATAGTFSDFAREMGASELPDLMEAAAAYTAFVEGQSHFSRPEIMKRVAAVDPALEVSREAGLRSFGQLLRQGKIRKLDRGQFVIDEDTRFNPGQRIAGE